MYVLPVFVLTVMVTLEGDGQRHATVYGSGTHGLLFLQNLAFLSKLL